MRFLAAVAAGLLAQGVVGCAGSPARRQESRVPSGGFAAELSAAARTEVLVLGTPHLGQVDCLDPKALERLVARLTAWRPDVIAVESLPAATLEALAGRTDEFAEQLRPFSKRSLEAGAIAAKTLGLDAAGLRRELKALSGTDAQTAQSRSRLVVLLLAAHEYPSAVLQWSYLGDKDRAAADLPDELRVMLDQSLRSKGEVNVIAVPLARALGLGRLALVDDFSGEEAYITRWEEFAREVQASKAVQEIASAAFYKESDRRLRAACAAPVAMSDYYDWVNSPEYGVADVALQWGVWFRTRFQPGLDRARYAGWEARNLAIAANIRKESSLYPGRRILVLYGAGHKPFLDAYLAGMLDVKLVQLADLSR